MANKQQAQITGGPNDGKFLSVPDNQEIGDFHEVADGGKTLRYILARLTDREGLYYKFISVK